MAKIKLTTVSGVDNTYTFTFSRNNLPVDPSVWTRIRLRTESGVDFLDSSLVPGCWSFVGNAVTIKLAKGLPPGTHTLRLIAYDPTYPAGWVFDTTILLTVFP